MKLFRSLIWSTLLCIFAGLIAANAGEAKRPNIVFMLADDLGYGELGCYGQEKIRTPNVDRLAAEGMKFLQHYTGAPVCAPARCVLMTGKNLSHAEIRGNKDAGNGRMFPGQWPISEGALTIAEVLKKAGYSTGAFGKWGLGPSNSSGSPIKQGFDRFYGYNCQRNAHSYYPFFLDSNEEEVRINPGLVYGHQRKPEGEVSADDYRLENYAPDMILDEALKFIDEAAAKEAPFFAYLPFVEPHVAMQSPQEWIDQYPEEWDQEKGVYRGQNNYLPHPRPRAAYAAMISDLDEHVGTVVERLEKLGVLDNTLIVFTSDNGTTHTSGDPAFHVGGVDAVFFNSVAGLRGWKGSVYEGGIRVPCLVRWPGKVEAGSENNEPTYFPDWFPTLAGIAGADAAGSEELDGIDLRPLLEGGKADDRDELMIWDFANYGGLIAIREGNWKAVRRDVMKKKPFDWELYDLENDIAEEVELAAKHPEIVKRLEKAFIETRIAEPDFPSPLYD
ncbi:arylsulfatase [Verrucomicrobiales bacterium BCK34]|nr:arylsulfatase [Verrucomicrobiales bacterium BCK34]